MTDRVHDNGEQEPASELTAVARKVAHGSEAMDFISSIVAGLLLGLGLDWWIGSRPAFTIVGIVLGFVAGFFKLWHASSVLEEQARERRRV